MQHEVGTLNTSVEILSQVFNDLITGDDASARRHLETLSTESEEREDRRPLRLKKQVKVFARDGYICRYCSRQTVCPPALRYISCCFPALFPYDYHWKLNSIHPLYYEICASCDHIIPVTRGGTNDLTNLATSCYRCNSRKSSYLLSEIDMELKPIAATEWDGLSGLFIRAYTNHLYVGSSVTGRLPRYERDALDGWLRAFEVVGEVPPQYHSKFDF